MTVHRFQLGDFVCWSISDGTRVYPAKAFFANAPQAELAGALERHGLTAELTTPFNALLVNTGAQRILVDIGNGAVVDTVGKLLVNLRMAGFTPQDVDTVILTHGHADHAGGAINNANQPAFPNARYLLSRPEWDYWISDDTALRIGESRLKPTWRIFNALQDRVSLIEPDAEIAPCIRALPAPGHTPGNIAVEIMSAHQRLVYIPDVFAHPIHLEHPDWNIVADADPERAITTRRCFLKLLCMDDALVLGYHFSPPGLGRVIALGDVWAWQAVVG